MKPSTKISARLALSISVLDAARFLREGKGDLPNHRQARVIGRLLKSEAKNLLDKLRDLKDERRRKFLGSRYKVTVNTRRELIRPIKGASSYSQSIKSDSPVSIWSST